MATSASRERRAAFPSRENIDVNTRISSKPVTLSERDDRADRFFLAKLAPPGGEYAAIFLTIAVYGFGQVGEMFDLANIIGPICLSVGVAWACWRLIATDVANLWTPLLWYRVSILAYFGVGALVPYFVNDATRDLMNQFFLAYGRDVLKYNLVVVVSHLVVISTSNLVLFFLDARQKTNIAKKIGSIAPSSIGILPIGVACLSIGCLINYFVVLPAVFDIYSFSALSALMHLSSISLVGYFMLTKWALENKSRSALYIVYAAAFGETIIGILAMTKFVALMPSVMIGLGYVFHRPNLFRMTIFGSVIMTTFVFMAPIITYAREVNQVYYAGDPKISEVVDIYSGYFGSSKKVSSGDEDYQTGWMRLSYTNAGSFAISQFDHGMPGNSYRYLPIVFIPRIIYPSKPFITDVSREFSYAANGNYDSSSSPGIAAEAYWNMGWTGVFIVAIFLGIMIPLWSGYCILVIHRDAWHLFFVVLVCMRVAVRTDGALVADFIGSLGFAVLAHFALAMLTRFLPQALARSRRPKPALR